MSQDGSVIKYSTVDMGLNCHHYPLKSLTIYGDQVNYVIITSYTQVYNSGYVSLLTGYWIQELYDSYTALHTTGLQRRVMIRR